MALNMPSPPQSRNRPRLRRWLMWVAAALLLPPLLAIALIAVLGWNWARAPLQNYVLEKTGRELHIAGDLTISPGWPAPRVHARAVTFANPLWARQKQMVDVDDVEFTVDLTELIRKKLVFPQVRLNHPTVFLEHSADGRKTWLLDLQQVDENAQISIGRLTLDRGWFGYEDANQQTSILLNLATQAAPADAAAGDGVTFSATGKFKGLTLAAQGSGGSVLSLRDDLLAYPFKLAATLGQTRIKAEGTVTSLFKGTAADIQLDLRGDSLAQLYPLIGIAFPQTRPYTTTGRVIHSGKLWRYEKLTGHVGNSDIAGTMQIELGGVRPAMRGDLVSKQLDFDDLRPIIGAKAAQPAQPPASSSVATAPRVLPEIPFKTERWSSVDADVRLRADTIARAKELPLENLVMHLKLQDSQLTLDPLDFGLAGGHLKATVSLDGRVRPIQARTKIVARRILLAKLFPTLDQTKASVGQINGEIDLAGRGDTVARMLATSDGRVSLIVEKGEISKLLMEQSGLHVLEILQLKIIGDKTVKLRCAVADFGVKSGVMSANALVLDTQISTLVGTGSIDLGHEELDLTLVPKTKATSPVALRSPIYVRGTFSKPVVMLDPGRIAARSAGALALALINPLLALIPLVEMGPGQDSDCGRLILEAKDAQPKARTSQ